MNEYAIRRELVELDAKIRNLSALLWLVFAMALAIMVISIVGTCRCPEPGMACVEDRPRKSLPFSSRPRKESRETVKE